KTKKTPVFIDDDKSIGVEVRHSENDFNDYDFQVLLPHKLSQMGPALTIGDVNNDGLDDFYYGGAANNSGALFIQNAEGKFAKTTADLWEKEKAYEDVDAIFVDINGDGFQDLYVVSGGNEYAANDAHYTDRLYLNDGKGSFNKGAILNLEKISGSKVIANDFDNDGDIDLFVGGRHKPYQYPLTTSSMLLQNDNGQLTNVTEKVAPGLINIGMVTDAVWTDYDNDGDTDLIVVGEWMPITVFSNENGQLIKKSIAAFDNTTGWWFSIEKGDFDNDGDDDFIVGNLGLNYKYKTSIVEPFDIYYNDFDNNGNGDIVLGYYSDDQHYPLRGFSCSSQQIPSLKEKIKKYDLFASLKIDEVYGEKNLEKSLHYSAKTFSSVYIENLGGGNFKQVDLPFQAQLSNINDFIVADFNKDGNLDFLAAGNLFVSEIETPRSDAGKGLFMLGDGKGSFTSISNQYSGFFARGDVKKLGVLKGKTSKKILVANNNDKLQVFDVKE
ncbi:MAG: VCBS repeat-containing protein, partial [Leeuwenhoekiella sp.]